MSCKNTSNSFRYKDLRNKDINVRAYKEREDIRMQLDSNSKKNAYFKV
ncbi:15001_t:CDS:2 [Cetraspora pellucida]|uniref:15001_t:CDS:1 n=1 Tax=Cetraspora pellucida TaxID=1433469 RepID=A0A9N9C0U0_9GLOM|nr:15001_t:CDS:2 [Cetraspora pellucida]